MKKYLPILVLLMCAGTVSAQITVTSAAFPAAGDTLRFAIDYSPGTIGSLAPPGAQDWDFTGLSADATQTIIYRPASEGSVSAWVPEANLLTVPDPNSEEYYIATPTTVEFVAHNGPDPYGIGVNALFRYNPPVVERRAPVNFFDINQISSGLLQPFSPEHFPPAFIASFPVAPDSLRFRIAISRLDVVDAWGSLSIPGGTYDVLREKRVFYREKRMDAKVPPLGWLDVTDVVIQIAGINLGVDTITTYHFYNDLSKEPIAVATLDRNQAFATQIVFKNTVPVVNATIEETAAKPGVQISPNPVGDEVVFDFKNLAPGRYRLAISDGTGRLAMEKFTQMGSMHTEQLYLSGLSSGMYFFNLFDEKGRVICREKLVKN